MEAFFALYAAFYAFLLILSVKRLAKKPQQKE